MNIEVVLTQDDPKLGKRGEIVKVSPGFAQNFLYPHKKAVPATAANKKSFEAEKANAARDAAERLASARDAAKRLKDTPVVLHVPAGEGDKLYGAVTAQAVHEALLGAGVDVDRRAIQLAEPIKRLGEYEVPVKLHPEVHATVKLTVSRKA